MKDRYRDTTREGKKKCLERKRGRQRCTGKMRKKGTENERRRRADPNSFQIHSSSIPHITYHIWYANRMDIFYRDYGFSVKSN